MYIPPKAHLMTARIKKVTSSGEAAALIKVPASGRMIAGGEGWFENHHADDYIQIFISDEDNILGGGAGEIVGGYNDDDVATANQGYYFKPCGTINLNPLAEIGFVNGGLYLKIVATKGDSSSDTFRCNIKWGKLL